MGITELNPELYEFFTYADQFVLSQQEEVVDVQWNLLKDYTESILNCTNPSHTEEQVRVALGVLFSCKMSSSVVEYLHERTKVGLKKTFNNLLSLLNISDIHKIRESYDQLNHLNQISKQVMDVRRLLSAVQEEFRIRGLQTEINALCQIILSKDVRLRNVIHHCLNDHFVQYNNSIDNMDESVNDDGMIRIEEICGCLSSLNLLESFEDIISTILFNQIRKKINHVCKGQYEEETFSLVMEWIEKVAFTWLSRIEQSIICDSPEHKSVFTHWRSRLDFFSFEYYVNLRTTELFDMIVQFPDTVGALRDLRSVGIDPSGTRIMMHRLQQRLLHPGANTNDIISTFININKSMRLLDSNGVTLEQVSEAVKSYIRSREDAMRCIVTSCIEDTTSELYQELMSVSDETVSNDSKSQGRTIYGDGSVDGDDTYEESHTWHPDSTYVSFSDIQSQRNVNLIGSLVDIWDNIDPFVLEYKQMLAEKLMACEDYDIDQHVKTLELLKLRFGEGQLHNCEIMIKDIADSKRVYNHYSREMETEDVCDMQSSIISHLFWPNIKDEKCKFPSEIQKKRDDYLQSYQKLRPLRDLEWKDSAGCIKLQLDFEDGRSIEFSVSPILAAIVYSFQETDTWNINDLSTLLEMQLDLLKKKLMYWVNNGVLKEIATNVYQIVEYASDKYSMGGAAEDEDEGDDNQAQMAQQCIVVENYICNGMLRTFPSLPLERIHVMLASFVDDYSLSATQLSDLMSTVWVFVPKLICTNSLCQLMMKSALSLEQASVDRMCFMLDSRHICHRYSVTCPEVILILGAFFTSGGLDWLDLLPIFLPLVISSVSSFDLALVLPAQD
ncbi:hypothetical protein PROFUN_14657 [Planoprotostelium fungivorum]|uniref:Anaphase-promoting complex subunit 2 n=1 Tax=Planoprotostelium fungivorum TaxID=1890364 RepID=A0A2P6MMQ6_9EUKA|nr:hypothetical protein PROFUN_14657 [Planoprotostelium fungivorum]